MPAPKADADAVAGSMPTEGQAGGKQQDFEALFAFFKYSAPTATTGNCVFDQVLETQKEKEDFLFSAMSLVVYFRAFILIILLA
jgi:hypothetical protein